MIVVHVRSLELDDVDAVVRLVLDALATDAAHNPLIEPDVDAHTLAASLRATRESCLVGVEGGVVRGHLYGVVLAGGAGDEAWTGPDGWSGASAVATLLRAAARERWYASGVRAHHVWVRDDADALAPWLADGYRVEDVRGLRALDDTAAGRDDLDGLILRRGRDVDVALRFDELIDAANGESPVRGRARRERRRFLADLLEDPETTQYLLERDGNVLAQCIAFAVEPTRSTPLRTLHLSAVAVEPAARRHGLARALVRAVLADGASTFTHAQVTWRPANAAASHLWRALGFRSTYARLVRSL
ncbi:MAG: GNAT family N-acetyltransferase [Acidobacteriota bacterium]|nr:GNAT family N-acetyltransferase [Acidobacteriota bacterium]